MTTASKNDVDWRPYWLRDNAPMSEPIPPDNSAIIINDASDFLERSPDDDRVACNVCRHCFDPVKKVKSGGLDYRFNQDSRIHWRSIYRYVPTGEMGEKGNPKYRREMLKAGEVYLCSAQTYPLIEYDKVTGGRVSNDYYPNAPIGVLRRCSYFHASPERVRKAREYAEKKRARAERYRDNNQGTKQGET